MDVKRRVSVLRAFEQVTREIMTYIKTEGFHDGERLPSERDLSEALNVSRSSIRESMRILEIMGFLDSRQGKGTFIASASSFLIPSKQLSQEVEKPILDGYYETGLAVSERIIFSAIEHKKPICNVEIKNSWESFSKIVTSLGAETIHQASVQLWLDIYDFLKGYRYFDNIVIELDNLVNAYLECDYLKVIKYFDSIAPKG